MKRILKFLCMVCLMMATATPAHADVSCRNLFDNTGFPRTNTVTTTIIQFIAANQFMPTIRLEEGVTYTLSYDIETNVSTAYMVGIGCGNSGYDRDIKLARNITTTNGRVSVTFTPTAKDLSYGDIFAFRPIWVPEAQNITYSISNVQLERGDMATSYVPYNPLCETCDGTVTNYESATGTVTQSGTPTPTNPIEPVFYKQGNMVLRKVGDYADSYDSATGKITRRVGVKVLNGTENWGYSYIGFWSIPSSEIKSSGGKIYCTHFKSVDSLPATGFRKDTCWAIGNNISLGLHYGEYEDIDTFKQYLADQYAAGTPVTVYYPLAEAVEESVGTSYCVADIKIATTKYTEEAFANLVTTLSEAITKVTNIVDTTVQQATEIGNLATTKQDRPDTDCPAGRKCLLIMGADNKPHWYLIQE